MNIDKRITGLALLVVFTVQFVTAQLSIGIRDTYYATIRYKYREHWQATYEESLFSEKIDGQYFRISAGYLAQSGCLKYSVAPFYGQVFDGLYHNYGAIISASAGIADKGAIYAEIAPWKDSTYGYKTCYLAGIGVALSQDITFVARYSTIPEYRQSEKRLGGGFTFRSGRLEISPMLTTSVHGDDKFKALRVNISFWYAFGF